MTITVVFIKMINFFKNVTCFSLLTLLISLTHSHNSIYSPLQDACQREDIPEVQTLLNRKSNDHFIKKEGTLSPLHIACQKKNSELMKILIKFESDVNELDYMGCAPLHVAVATGNYDIAKLLLEESANPDIQSAAEFVYAPIHLAVLKNDVDMIYLLSTYNANLDSRTQDSRFSPLHIAVKTQHVDAVKALLELCPISVDGIDENRSTALHYACQIGDDELVSTLIEANAYLFALNSSNLRPSQVAIIYDHTSLADTLTSLEFIFLSQDSPSMEITRTDDKV